MQSPQNMRDGCELKKDESVKNANFHGQAYLDGCQTLIITHVLHITKLLQYFYKENYKK